MDYVESFCPFCGATPPRIGVIRQKTLVWVTCFHCGAQGPLVSTLEYALCEDRAWRVWNERAPMRYRSAPSKAKGYNPPPDPEPPRPATPPPAPPKKDV